MTDETPPKPPGPEGLQFDRVESTQPIIASCSACKGPLGDPYYLAGTLKICERCRDGVQSHLSQGSGSGRFLKAALLGLLAALGGGLIWAIIKYKSGGGVYGIVAIGLGYLVGLGVRKGSGARGGRGYQALAITLTYLGIAFGYAGAAIPESLELMKPNGTIEEPAVKPEATEDRGAKRVQPELATLDFVVLLALILAGCLGSPVQVGMEHPITLLFLGIALWEAWKLNRGTLTQLKGPFRAGIGGAGG